jgi:hypothetical protein
MILRQGDLEARRFEHARPGFLKDGEKPDVPGLDLVK